MNIYNNNFNITYFQVVPNNREANYTTCSVHGTKPGNLRT